MKYCRKVVILWIVMVVGVTLSCRREPQEVGSPPKIEWLKIFDSIDINGIEETKDQGFIITGSKDNNVLIAKLDPSGDIIWDKTYEGNWGYSILHAIDGGYFVSGSPFFLMKVDSMGMKEWMQEYEDGEHAFYEDGITHQTKDGGFIITGTAVGRGRFFLLIKTDSLGNVEWKRVYTEEGCSHTNKATECLQTTDSGYVVIGWSLLRKEGIRTIVIKANSQGHPLWRKVLGDKNETMGVIDIEQTPDGGYIIVGVHQKKEGECRTYLVKLDSLGEIQLNKEYPLGTHSEARSVHIDSDGQYVISGYLKNEEQHATFVMKVDSVGRVIWRGIYGDTDDVGGGRAISTLDGGYVIAGAKYKGELISTDAILIKLKPEE